MATATSPLASVPIFRELPPKTLKRLDRIAHTRRLDAGEHIVQEGHEGAGVFVITEGTTTVTRDGREIATLGPGDAVGEMAVLDHHPRSATVTAVTPVTCVGVARWDFLAEARNEPDILIELLRAMSMRLRAVDEQLV